MKKAIKDLRSECSCEKEKYCPLEALLDSMNDRILEQHKMVEYYRFRLGEQGEPNLPWNDVYMRWVELGYAKKFADIYSPDKTYRQMRKEMFGK